jgi:hypothetical protein
MQITNNLLFLAIALAAAASSDAADSDISVKDIGNDQYELSLHTTATTNIAVGQLQLAPTAKRTCRDKEMHFGHYSFDISQPLSDTANKASTFTLTQTIRCGAESPPAIPQTTSAPDGWKPSAIDQSQVETQTYQYYRAKDAGQYVAAYAMFDDQMKETSHFDTWSAHAQSQNTKAGHVLNRRVLKITWYKDPPSAPEPGIYAAADFAGQFENDPIYCGYVAWHRGADGTFRVVREEENFIDKGSIANMGQKELRALTTRFGCPTPE